MIVTVRKLFGLLVVPVVLAGLLSFGAATVPGQGQNTAHAASPIYGENFGTTTDSLGLHHYVSFRINPPHFGNWRVEGPVVSWLPGGTNPTPWPQKTPYYVLAGFHFPDNLNPYLFLKPSDYRLYPA